MNDTKRLLKNIYKALGDGYDISGADEKAVKKSHSSSVYGEIMPAATEHLLNYLNPDKHTVLYDLGSGAGKFVLQAAMTVPAKKIVGVELAADRVRIADQALKQVKKASLQQARSVVFRQDDILQTHLRDATMIYSCSTAFPPKFMRKLAKHLSTLKPGLVFASLQDFEDEKYFFHEDTLRLDMSWRRRVPVYIYRLHKQRRG